jgi:non-heme chloroperoxidase
MKIAVVQAVTSRSFEGRFIMSAGRRLPGTPDPSRYFEGAGGCRLAADEWGDAAGPLVTFQHGGGQTRHAWKGAGERLGAAG